MLYKKKLTKNVNQYSYVITNNAKIEKFVVA